MFKCNICNASFSLLNNLSVHKKKHKEQEKGYECPECGKIIKVKGKLSVHIKTIHKGLKYKCAHCDKEFSNTGSRFTHIKSVHEQIKYPCQLCSYQATQPGHLRLHTKSVHEKMKYPCKEIQCPICSKER